MWSYVFSLPPDVVVVTGGARGVDATAALAALASGHEVEIFPVTDAEWMTHGKIAGHLRNERMIPTVDAVTAFWDGKTPGTGDALDIAVRCRIPINVIYGPVYQPRRRR